ncbi:hypothetical protein [Pseudomonas sp. SWI36]|uniref:Uncharacterized protein n=1 Tax=Pseudomonas sp. 13.2 TaxID=3144665 RepID=A0AAU7BI74_9PSED|nr:hypothetical protein [Pseudomonas sp. SWI36]
MIRKITLAAALSLLVCSGAFAAGTAASKADLTALKSAMEDKLKDAESSKFKDVRIAKDGTTCGLVNAKNSYGAYSGFEPFIAMKLSTGKFFVLSIDEAAGQVCSSKNI